MRFRSYTSVHVKQVIYNLRGDLGYPADGGGASIPDSFRPIGPVYFGMH